VHSLIRMIQAPFYSISEVLSPHCQPSPILSNLGSSPSTPLYTALVVLLPSCTSSLSTLNLSIPKTETHPTALSSLEHFIIDSISPQIPIIILPHPSTSTHARYPSALSQKLSSFRPSSALALRTGLFRSPETLSTLRSEAADRFLRWREVERAVDEIHSVRRVREDERKLTQHHLHRNDSHNHTRAWSKAKWEAEWETGLSREVAQRLREDTITAHDTRTSGPSNTSTAPPHVMWMGNTEFDPLHIPSLFLFSLSLFGPLTGRIARSVEETVEKMQPRACHVGLALVGGFFFGVGFGMLVR
jgi:hypothetical protein